MIGRLVRHETLSFVRTPMAAVFTVAIPLLMTVIVGAAVGNQVVQPGSGVRVMQFVVPVMAVFGVAQGCFGALAIRLADLRDRGWLKRLRGTPVPASAVLAGLAGASLVIASVTVAVLLAVGVVFYDVQPVWRTLPALLLTLLIGAACFTALGFAVVALVRSAAAVQLLGTGLLLGLAFISDVILVGARLPAWLDAIGWIFPLRHLAHAVRDAMNPFLTGAGLYPDHLAVLLLWGIGGAALAVRRFRWERPAARTRTAGTARERRARSQGRPSPWRLLAAQAGHALVRLRRDLSTAFFTVILPVLLLALISLIFADARVSGVRLPVFMLAAMITYTVGVASYVNIAEATAGDRERGVLKRLAGTPLPRWAYHAGHLTTALLVTLATTAVLALVAVLGYDVRIEPRAVPGILAATALGAACFTVLGAVVVAFASNQQTVNAITLGTFLPLAFVSDVFVVGGELPGALRTVGDVFPLRHVSHAILAVLDPAGRPWPWTDLAMVAAWTLGGLAVLAVVDARRGAGPLRRCRRSSGSRDFRLWRRARRRNELEMQGSDGGRPPWTGPSRSSSSP
ncbi:ABC-2 type transporter [Nonomuraea coxensis DSM 45129]|uniref:Transport permease protein n=1 Tax=Nonomuraea coxensis DSM 45129 TaxID=1122611 RepID=A0ABX8U1X8_9ACTN|nr:ABC transporter permease [Nonomuraea coxensis]QYC41658.1 ABC-2 type transporter [Nonomuraea coxensis DSM 45129]